ncbi:MAG: hypothetical protein KC420_19345 [Myxococcales bacterium]|nr:hypothetical protein [Myxococcales bacterium]
MQSNKLLPLGRAQEPRRDELFYDAEDALGDGDIERARTRYALARELLGAHLAVAPDDIKALDDLAIFLAREAEAETDLGSLSAALDRLGEAQQLWLQLADADPKRADDYRWWYGESLARAAFIRGEGFDLAEDACLRIRGLDDFDHARVAQLEWAQGRFEAARERLVQHQGSTAALLDLAAVEIDLGEDLDAAEHLRLAQRLLSGTWEGTDPNLQAYVELLALRLEPSQSSARETGKRKLEALLGSPGPDRVLVARYRRWLGLPLGI